MDFSNLVELGDYCNIKGGKRLPKGTKLMSTPTKHAYIKVKDMSANKYVSLNADFEYLDVETFNEISRYTVNKGDIILSIVGTTGLISIIDKSLDGANLTENCVKLVEIKDFDKDYLYYYLLSEYGQNEIKKGIVGSTQPKLPIYNIKKIKIYKPDIVVQKEIAHLLSTLDRKIEINKQINQKLEEMAQAIFKHWFVDFEFPNENGEPYKSSGGEMVESELGMIPEDWKVQTLDKIVELSTKSVNPQNHPERLFEHFSIPAFDKDKTPELQYGEEIKSNKYIINDKVVLISKLNPSTKRIWKPFPQHQHSICSTEFMIYKAKEENTLSYIYELLNNDAFSEMLVSHATGSTGSRQRVKPAETLNFKFSIPPVNIMKQFSKLIEPMHNNVSLNIVENQKLLITRDNLLPKLMSGEIRVPVEK